MLIQGAQLAMTRGNTDFGRGSQGGESVTRRQVVPTLRQVRCTFGRYDMSSAQFQSESRAKRGSAQLKDTTWNVFPG